jgi:phosphoadenylyl-sulfate reductase (thioredoxin)
MRAYSPQQLHASAEALEGKRPEEVLAWAVATFGPRLALATGFGAEGCVLIHLVAEHRLPIDIFTLDTGLLFPETYALWQKLECRYGVRIQGVRPHFSVSEQEAQHGPALWDRDPDRCCAMRKVEPLRRFLAPLDAWITAIRRDQTPARATAKTVGWDAQFGLVKVNPLVAWTARDVWQFITREKVPYNPLHDRGFASIGCAPCTSAVADGEDHRAGRWRGREKDECGLHGPIPLTEVGRMRADRSA